MTRRALTADTSKPFFAPISVTAFSAGARLECFQSAARVRKSSFLRAV